MAEKTKGQLLYEHKFPKFIRVIPADCRFPTEADVMLVPNPRHHVDWQFLTKKSQEDWERTAEGHSFFS